jgi:uncharacterized protein
MQIEEIQERISAIRLQLVAEGIVHLAVFGSQARGNARPNSDLDVLIDVPAGSNFSLFDIVEVESIISEATGIPANAFMRRSLDDGFYQSISKDIRVIF